MASPSEPGVDPGIRHARNAAAQLRIALEFWGGKLSTLDPEMWRHGDPEFEMFCESAGGRIRVVAKEIVEIERYVDEGASAVPPDGIMEEIGRQYDAQTRELLASVGPSERPRWLFRSAEQIRWLLRNTDSSAEQLGVPDGVDPDVWCAVEVAETLRLALGWFFTPGLLGADDSELDGVAGRAVHEMVFAKLELERHVATRVSKVPKSRILETVGRIYDRETMRQPESHKRISDGLPHAGDY